MKVDRLLKELRALSMKLKFVLVGIDGLGGAGKSTVAKFIKEEIPDTTIIEMDDFYVPELVRADWDRASEQVIDPLRECHKITYPF